MIFISRTWFALYHKRRLYDRVNQHQTKTGEEFPMLRANLLLYFLLCLGNLKDCTTELSGNVEIPNVSDENDLDEIDVS